MDSTFLVSNPSIFDLTAAMDNILEFKSKPL
jgi:hypothetical protein